MEDDYRSWNLEKLRCRADQEWEMAGLARQDGDAADTDRRTRLARAYEQEVRERR